MGSIPKDAVHESTQKVVFKVDVDVPEAPFEDFCRQFNDTIAESRRDDVVICVHPNQAVFYFTELSRLWVDSRVDMRLEL